MRCERIQELILTDYMDKELDEKLVREVDGHILSCAACREFKRVAEQKAVQPFKAVPSTAASAQAPSYIWERVKREVAREGTGRTGILENIFRYLGKIPRPAVAFAAAAVLIIAVLVARPIAQTRAANDYIAEQMEFMVRLDMAETNGNGNFFTDTDV
jgi:anti-sigma factor RsiW